MKYAFDFIWNMDRENVKHVKNNEKLIRHVDNIYFNY